MLVCGCEVIPHHVLWDRSVHPLLHFESGHLGFIRLPSGARLSGASGYDEFPSAPSVERVIRPSMGHFGSSTNREGIGWDPLAYQTYCSSMLAGYGIIT